MIQIFDHRNELYRGLFPHGGIVAEIGVFAGQNARAIWDLTAPRELHLIDLWDYRFTPTYQAACAADPRLAPEARPADQMGAGPLDETGWRAVREECRARFPAEAAVIQHPGISWAMAGRFADGFFDAVYVDGDHFRDGCRADLEAFAPKLAPRGILAGHDFCFDFDGVIAAVFDFLNEHRDWQLVALGRGRFTSYALQRRESSPVFPKPGMAGFGETRLRESEQSGLPGPGGAP